MITEYGFTDIISYQQSQAVAFSCNDISDDGDYGSCEFKMILCLLDLIKSLRTAR